MMQALILFLCLSLSAHAYDVVANPDNGDFTIFPLVALGTTSFPTTMTFSPDGRIFVGQKNGIIRVIDANGNLQPTPWLDLSDRVNSAGDKGLTSIVLHPQFPTVPYLYATYPLWQSDSRDLNRVTQGIVARYTDVSGSGSISSEFLLVGRINGTGFPSCHNSHVTGDLIFGTDGTLFASAGEGSHWDSVDDGLDDPWAIYDWQCSPFFGPENDIGSFRAQSMTSMGGRIVRMDPATGQGIGPDNFPNLIANPFYDAAKPSSPASLTWAIGFRNPWKLRIKPNTPAPGTLYVADVGAKDYEEINVVRAEDRGSNYGWPCQTANRREQPWFTNAPTPTEYYVPRYPTRQATVDRCNNLKPSLTQTKIPAFFYSRSQYVYGEKIGIIGNCASGMAFYEGDSYPDRYRGKDTVKTLFISDFGNQWIKVIRLDGDDKYVPSYGVQDFLDNVGAILFMTTSPVNKDVYYVTQSGEINRIRYTSGYVGAPIVSAEAFPSFINIANRPATVQFSSDNTFDPSESSLEFLWNFGDGTVSRQPNPSHTFTTGGTFKVNLQVKNAAGFSSEETVTVVTDNDPPQAKIAGAQWFQFNSGQEVRLTAQFTDDSTPTDRLQWQWEYALVHNNHIHPAVLTVPSSGFGRGPNAADSRMMNPLISIYERNTLEIKATVWDERGASTTARVIAVPNLPDNPNYANTAPVAHFNSDQRGSSVYFDGGSTFDFDVDVLDFDWNWGDGTKGKGMVVHHTFPATGIYQVNLTVTDPWKASSTFSLPVSYVATQNVTASSTSSSSDGQVSSSPSLSSSVGTDSASKTRVETKVTGSDVPATTASTSNNEPAALTSTTVEPTGRVEESTATCVFFSLGLIWLACPSEALLYSELGCGVSLFYYMTHHRKLAKSKSVENREKLARLDEISAKPQPKPHWIWEEARMHETFFSRQYKRDMNQSSDSKVMRTTLQLSTETSGDRSNDVPHNTNRSSSTSFETLRLDTPDAPVLLPIDITAELLYTTQRHSFVKPQLITDSTIVMQCRNQ
ncbi:PKD domain containing protein [Planoprotostelium fungivorum]|uniref:PKD domain containing protein n=1 Tax=Planoprotostelium fungivorum TaxID=1890364 RepID=A0A2P6NF27_9EUKA|nr:PKD domain containing protein [Planoprotostelium fungivorum]